MSEHIEISRDGAVQTIRMNRPDKKNAITRAMYAAMAKALTDGDADDTVRVHLILGVPGAFSSGNDLADFMAVATGGEQGTEVADFLQALALAQKPVVSGVDGIAVGIGTTINFHCDLTLATPRTRFHTPFVDLGLVPEAGSSLLAPAIMGHARAAAMLMLGEPMDAEGADRAGFVTAIVTGDALLDHARAKAAALMAKPPQALMATRRLMKGDPAALQARIAEEARLFREALASPEAQEAFMAFFEKRAPVFKRA